MHAAGGVDRIIGPLLRACRILTELTAVERVPVSCGAAHAPPPRALAGRRGRVRSAGRAPLLKNVEFWKTIPTTRAEVFLFRR